MAEPDVAERSPLARRTALVTGASRGIGAEIAQRLSAAGARVALVARTLDALQEHAARIGNSAVAIDADLADEAAAAHAADRVRNAFGAAPDIVVNNAGIFQVAQLHEMPVEDYSRALSANLLAPFIFLRAFLPEMRERASGHIVTIGSIADRSIFAGNGAYSATKFGVRAMHEVLREETRGTGVRATLVSPASVDTGIWDGIRFPGESAGPDRRSMLERGAVADAVLFALTRPMSVNIDELRLSRA